MQHAVTGPLGKPQHLELQHKQADGLGHEDHPPHQQGGDGELIWKVLETKVFNSRQYFPGSQNPRSRSCGSNWVILPGASEFCSLLLWTSKGNHAYFLVWNLPSRFSCVFDSHEWKDEYLRLKWVKIHIRERTLLSCSFIDRKSIAVINSVLIHDQRVCFKQLCASQKFFGTRKGDERQVPKPQLHRRIKAPTALFAKLMGIQ